MALIKCNFYSFSLKKDTTAFVVLPEHRDWDGRSLKVLTLLHGLGDDASKWVRRTPIERYAKAASWAVVMPDGEAGFYTDNVYGVDYWTYISEELPQYIRSIFPILSSKREDNYVAGLSMGGYGAFKLALNHPDQYCAAASFSGVLNIQKRIKNHPEREVSVFGSREAVAGTSSDLFHTTLMHIENNQELPRLYISCGTEDRVYEDSVVFRDFLEDCGIALTYEEWQGDHDWEFWDESIKRALKWFIEDEKR